MILNITPARTLYSKNKEVFLCELCIRDVRNTHSGDGCVRRDGSYSAYIYDRPGFWHSLVQR